MVGIHLRSVLPVQLLERQSLTILSSAADRRCCQEEVIDPGKRQGGLARVPVRGVEFTIHVGLP